MASIKKDPKTNKWTVRVSYKDSEGKFRTKTKKGISTKTEAMYIASQLETKKTTQDLSDPNDLTVFANYFEKWVQTYVYNKYSVGTDKKYEREIKYVKNYFKQTKLVDLTRVQYQEYINWRGTNRSKNTVQKTHGYLKKCLSYALADGLITNDPSFGAILKYDVEETDRLKYLNVQQINILNEFLSSNLDDLKNLMLFIALQTGMRIGEVYALAYDDFADNSLSIKRAYDYVLQKDFTSGKTKSAVRTIAVSSDVVLAVKRHRMVNQLLNYDYLFLNHKNKPRISHTGLSKHFKNLLIKLDLPVITIHGLRHSHASHLLSLDFNIGYISKRLGHATITETLNTYTHIITELEQKSNDNVRVIYNAHGAK